MRSLKKKDSQRNKGHTDVVVSDYNHEVVDAEVEDEDELNIEEAVEY